MEIAIWIAVGVIAYVIIGNVVACCMSLAGHCMTETETEKDFKVIIALWPAPLTLWLMEGFVAVITFPFGGIYSWIKKFR